MTPTRARNVAFVLFMTVLFVSSGCRRQGQHSQANSPAETQWPDTALITITGKVEVVMEFGGIGEGGLQMSPVILLDCAGVRYELVPTPAAVAGAPGVAQGIQIPVPGSEMPLTLQSGSQYKVDGYTLRQAVETRLVGSTNREASITVAAETLAARVVPPPPSLMKGKTIDTKLFFPWSTAKLRYKLAIEEIWDRTGSNILLLLTHVEHVPASTDADGSSVNR